MVKIRLRNFNTVIYTEEHIQEVEQIEDTEVLSPQLIAEQLTFDKSMGLLWPLQGDVVIPYSPDHGVFHFTLEQFGTSDAVVLSSTVGTQVKAYLATKNNRFEFVYTPKHGSWLNLIDNLGTSENSPNGNL